MGEKLQIKWILAGIFLIIGGFYKTFYPYIYDTWGGFRFDPVTYYSGIGFIIIGVVCILVLIFRAFSKTSTTEKTLSEPKREINSVKKSRNLRWCPACKQNIKSVLYIHKIAWIVIILGLVFVSIPGTLLLGGLYVWIIELFGRTRQCPLCASTQLEEAHLDNLTPQSPI